MQPTVGRIINVWFRGDYAPGNAIFGSQPWPAIITHVWDDTGALSSVNYAGHEQAALVWWEWPRRETTPGTKEDLELAHLKSSHMKMG